MFKVSFHFYDFFCQIAHLRQLLLTKKTNNTSSEKQANNLSKQFIKQTLLGNSIPRIYCKEIIKHIHKKVLLRMFTLSLFTIVENWKPHKCPKKEMDKSWHIRINRKTYKYYIYFFKTYSRESMHRSGDGQREGGRESQADSSLSAEPITGLNPTTHEIMT